MRQECSIRPGAPALSWASGTPASNPRERERCGAESCVRAAGSKRDVARGRALNLAFGRTLIAIGVIFVIAGLLITLGARLPFRIGRLPGDIVWRGRNSVFYFPLATCLLLSLVLSLVMWLLNRR